MAKKPRNAKAPAAPVAFIVEQQPTNVVQLNAQQSGGDEPPQSALHAKVLAYCEGLRDLTTVQLHALAMECMKHAEAHGDLRPLIALQNNLPKSMRKLELARWAAAFAPIKWGKKDDQDACEGAKLAKQGDKEFKPWNLAGAQAVPFYNTPEAEKPKGIRDAVAMLIKANKDYQAMLDDPNQETIKRKDGLTDAMIRKQMKINRKMLAAAA